MDQRTCIRPGCDGKQHARKLCEPHYLEAYRRGEIPQTDRSSQHRLSDVDLDARRGVCSHCGPVDVRVRTSGGRTRRQCGNQARESWNRRRPPLLWRKYKLTEELREQMIAEQEGRCVICREEAERLVVDHCHTTGRVRAMLCNGCNSGIGIFRDDPALFLAAIAYVQAHAARIAEEVAQA